MPYISCNSSVFNVSDKEAFFLELLKEKINNSYAPAKLNYSVKDLISYYLSYEESFIQAIHSKLDNFNPLENEDKLKEFETLAGYPVTKYLSIKTDGKYAMYNVHNKFFNVLFSYFFMNPIGFRKIAKDNLKDNSILTSIIDVIKDKRILSLIYPNGYDRITVYDFLKRFSFTVYENDGLKDIEGIGPVSLAKINQALTDFGYPLLFGNDLYSLNKNIGYSYGLEKLLLLTKSDLEKLGFSQSMIEKLSFTKYINNRKTIEQTTNSSVKITEPDIIQKLAKDTAKRIAEKQISQSNQPKEVKAEEKQPVQNDKYLELISKMPKSIIKNMIIKEFKSNLKLLLDLGKKDPQILLDYAECIPFKRYQKMEDIPQVMAIIRIQPKLIRKLETRMITLIQSNLNQIVFSPTLTKGEQSSLNAYVNKKLDEYYAKVINKGIKPKTKNR